LLRQQQGEDKLQKGDIYAAVFFCPEVATVREKPTDSNGNNQLSACSGADGAALATVVAVQPVCDSNEMSRG